MYKEEIARIRQAAADALTRFDAHQEHDSARLGQLRARGRAAAQAVTAKADAPLAIGDVGEYNTAKSTIAGVLLGEPLLLSRSENPTTGNVTVLRLRPGPADVATRMTAAEVQFMTEAELSRCVAFVLGRLSEAATRDAPAKAAASVFAGYNPAVDGWARFDTWCRTALWDTPAGDVTLKLIAMELVRLRDAQLNAAQMIGQTRGLAVEEVAGGVALSVPTSPPAVFPELATTHGLRWDVPLDTERLRVAFPLIRRITVNVTVNPAAWPLRDLRDDYAVELRDYPGLNAQGTQWRDLFVSRLGLEGIDAVMVLLDSRKPAAAATLTFYSELRRLGFGQQELDRATVVAASWFDKVPLPTGGQPLRLRELLDTSALLNGVYVAAQNLTGARHELGEPLDRAVLVSSLPALIEAGASAEDPQTLAVAPERQAAWADVADRLLAGEPASEPARHLAHLLREYAADGGIAALRALVEDHLRQHGLPNKLAQLRRAGLELDGVLADYQREVAWLASQATSTTTSQATRIVTFFEELGEAARRVRENAREFRDPARLTFTRPGQETAEPLLAAAGADIADVWFWDSWENIVNSLDERQPVVSPQEPAPGAEPELALTTAELEAEFVATVEKQVKRYRELVLASVDRWDDRQRTLLAGPASRLDDPEVHALALKVLGPERMIDVEDLAGRNRTGTIRARVERSLDTGGGGRRGRSPRDAVPFATRHALPWHPGFKGTDDGSEQRRHLAAVTVLRQEAVHGVTTLVQEQVTLLAADVSACLEQQAARWVAALPRNRELRDLLRGNQ
ncbi:hypothetical protein ND748_17815 [Frankia sp. AiPs1]|uniref:hypothetical protein n=1 Tax=Frankia sp. AiPs1 TaxID=573493 RepID=UPI0020441A1F|nr:hypothetical protein [Frankia sp. AiPs1]MCM3923512.1 hypothetical protein [Frankia sp. AiPs1]